MTLIEGIGDEVTHFFIVLCLTVILTVAWWTTNTPEQRTERGIRAVVFLDRRRQRRSQQLSSHTESVTISEGLNPVEGVSVSNEDGEQIESMSAESNKPPEASTSAEETNEPVGASSNAEECEQVAILERMDDDTCVIRKKPRPEVSSNEEGNELFGETNDLERDEQVAILELVDNHTCVVRQRRLEFYEGHRDIAQGPQSSTPTSSNLEKNGSDALGSENDVEGSSSQENSTEAESSGGNGSNIRIKLKYINDDLKLVDGSLEEQLGSFKRRHFEDEISANKLVRLIFNGQVLQPDNATLESCGLFDNCVVHCLIHPKRTNLNEDASGNNRNERFLGNRSGGQQTNNNNQGREWDLGNLLFALISFILGSAWYFRYVYAHLYTITATVALVAVTGIFTVVLIGMYFPEHHEPVRQQQQRAE